MLAAPVRVPDSGAEAGASDRMEEVRIIQPRAQSDGLAMDGPPTSLDACHELDRGAFHLRLREDIGVGPELLDDLDRSGDAFATELHGFGSDSHDDRPAPVELLASRDPHAQDHATESHAPI
jgi:hypothetical protein